MAKVKTVKEGEIAIEFGAKETRLTVPHSVARELLGTLEANPEIFYSANTQYLIKLLRANRTAINPTAGLRKDK